MTTAFADSSLLPASSSTTTSSKAAVWTGRVLSAIAILFLAFDGTFKLFLTPESVNTSGDLGWAAEQVFKLGVLQLILLALYVIPRTSVIGALLWTGYLGGAVATHVRVGNPLFSHTLFPIYVAIFVWGGLYLRDRRVKAMLSFER